MTMQDLAAALTRAQTALERRPDLGLHDDAAAIARWQGGTRVTASHANGTGVSTDMPSELGGTGDHVTPGWLFRAGIASCAVTSITMAAALEGITLTTLEVQAGSRSDTRGLLGMCGSDGAPVDAAPREIALQVRIGADGVAPERLRALVDNGLRCSPIPSAVRSAVPIALNVDIDTV